MEEYFLRIWNDLIGRVDGPMRFRFILQPLVSIYFAYKAGKRDAKTGGVPYFIGLFTSKGNTKELLKQGWKDVGKVFILAVVLDIVYQLIMIYSRGTQTAYHPLETLITAFLLGFVPYIIFRGPFNRIFRNKKGG